MEYQYGEIVLVHHGIKGQKWGVRRFQNEDGSLTEEGKQRLLSYKVGMKRLNKRENYLGELNDELLARPGNAYRQTVNTETLKNQTHKIKDDSLRTYKLGRKTINWRIGIGTVGALATAGATVLAATGLGSVPVGLIAAAAGTAGTLFAESQTTK